MSDLTPKEQACVRVALRYLRARAGGWTPLARVLRSAPKTLGAFASDRNYRPPTPSIAVRIARLAQVGVDDVLAGRFPEAGVCAHCGARASDRAAE